jgi:hypothetical protein
MQICPAVSAHTTLQAPPSVSTVEVLLASMYIYINIYINIYIMLVFPIETNRYLVNI